MNSLEEAKREWIADAVQYLYMLGVYEQSEIYDALSLAESLLESSVATDGEILYSAVDAVDEEMTYWGE